jgi:hypothetical protein
MKFGADKAGRKAKCPKCDSVLTIPGPQANGPAGPASGDEEGDAGYGVLVDHDLEARRRRIEEEDRLRAKELKKKKPPKIVKKFKSLPEAERWEKVHLGLLFVFLGTCIWAFSHMLVGLWVGLGTVEFTDYARMVTEQIERQEPVIPERGEFWNFSQFHHLVAIAAGRGFVGFAKFCIVVGLILYPLQAILCLVGYILCLRVPQHHGTLGQLITMIVLNAFNFLAYFFFKLLPIVGVYRYYLIPYLIPEIMFTSYNMERAYPYFMLWSPSPFWESLLSMFLMFMAFLEPIMGVIFVWSCARQLKADRLEQNSDGVASTGFGQYFLWFCLVMIALCGTTPVLVWTLRALYLLWYGALMMFIVRYALLLWRFRDLLDFRLNPEG